MSSPVFWIGFEFLFHSKLVLLESADGLHCLFCFSDFLGEVCKGDGLGVDTGVVVFCWGFDSGSPFKGGQFGRGGC